MFTLDTDVLSERIRKRPDRAVAAWLAGLAPEQVSTTVVTVTEIQGGITRAARQHRAAAANLSAWLDGMLSDESPVILPLNLDAARILGRMLETPSLRHFVMADPKARKPALGADLSIAAIAIANGAVIASRNIRHFLQIHAEFPLPGLFDPAAGTWHVAWTAP